MRRGIVASTILLGCSLCAQDVGRITGTVVDQVGERIAQAKVSLTDSYKKTQSVSANSVGDFELDGVAPGEYILTVIARGFKDQSLNVRAEPGRTTALSTITLHIPPVESCPPFYYEPPTIRTERLPRPSSEIRGSVTDLRFNPIRGVSVTIHSRDGDSHTVRTDSRGGFQFRDVPSGVYSLTASLPGHADFLIRELRVDQGQRTRIQPALQMNKCEAGSKCEPVEKVREVTVCL